MRMHHDHVAIITANPTRLRAWYADTLGFELLQEWTVDVMPGVELSYIGRDDFKIEVIGPIPDSRPAADSENPFANLTAGYNHFAIRVADIAALVDEVTGKGARLIVPVTEVPQAGIIAAMMLDIDRNLVELIQRRARSTT